MNNNDKRNSMRIPLWALLTLAALYAAWLFDVFRFLKVLTE